MPIKSAHLVPVALFDYQLFEPADRLPAFRDLTSDMYDIDAIGNRDEFKVRADGYRVDNLIFNTVSFSPSTFHRNTSHLQGDKQNFLVLEFMLEGRQLVTMNSGQIHMTKGTIYLRDWEQEFKSDTDYMRLHSVIIPRDRLKVSQYLNEQHPILSLSTNEASGELISKIWLHLLSQFSSTSVSDAKILTSDFLSMLDDLLGYNSTNKPNTSFDSMCHYILSRLHNEISASEICNHFHISRSSVYRAFESEGGIKRYITKERLRNCYLELRIADPSRTKVSDIFQSWGFYEASTFTRAFKRIYKTTPSAILQTQSNYDNASKSKSEIANKKLYSKYHNWFKEITGNNAS